MAGMFSSRARNSSYSLLLFLLCAVISTLPSSADLCIAENGGHGETPPPIGSITRVDDAGAKTLVSEDLEDPVWITADQNTSVAYVGLFHAGEIVSVELESGATTTIAHGLSCPEGVALDGVGNLW